MKSRLLMSCLFILFVCKTNQLQAQALPNLPQFYPSSNAPNTVIPNISSEPIPVAVPTITAPAETPLTEIQAATETLPEKTASLKLDTQVVPSNATNWDVTPEAGPTWYQPSYWWGPVPWDAGVELGLNGSSGSNDSFSMRAGGFIKRETETSKFDLSLYHNSTSSKGIQTQNNATLDVRHDWKLGKSPWSIFATGALFYDEFQDFDLQINLNSGVGYQLIKNELTDLTGRFGAGAVKEFGGPNSDWEPEALFGLDYKHTINASQKIYAKLDYFPEFSDFGNYRTVTDVGWEVVLNQPRNLSLKMAATNRFDSTSTNTNQHNLNYSVLLIWKL